MPSPEKRVARKSPVEPVRTWTLTTGQPLVAQPQEALSDRSKLWREQRIESGPTLWDGEQVRVLEAAPILDLLESWLAIDARARSPLTEQTESILRANGRTR